MVSEVGDTLGAYRIVSVIGRGGMGVVYEAVDTRLGRSVALKVLSPTLSSDPEFRARFTDEAAVLAKLDSPHIVQIYEAGEADGWLFLAAQLISGGDLSARTRQLGAFAPAVALPLVSQVCEGLADAHEVGIVHRDIKPSNILVRERIDGLYPYLCDFGIAITDSSDHTRTGQVVGSTAYIAPERHSGVRADVRSDIYSVGCVLWGLLHGGPPYTGTDVQVAMAHMYQPVPQLEAPGATVEALNAVLARAMAKEPDERYQSTAELRDALAAVPLDEHRWLPIVTAPRVDEQSELTTFRPATAMPAAAATVPAPVAPAERVEHTNPGGSSARKPGRAVAVVVALCLVVAGVALGVRALNGGSSAKPAAPLPRAADTLLVTTGVTVPPLTKAPKIGGRGAGLTLVGLGEVATVKTASGSVRAPAGGKLIAFQVGDGPCARSTCNSWRRLKPAVVVDGQARPLPADGDRFAVAVPAGAKSVELSSHADGYQQSVSLLDGSLGAGNVAALARGAKATFSSSARTFQLTETTGSKALDYGDHKARTSSVRYVTIAGVGLQFFGLTKTPSGPGKAFVVVTVTFERSDDKATQDYAFLPDQLRLVSPQGRPYPYRFNSTRGRSLVFEVPGTITQAVLQFGGDPRRTAKDGSSYVSHLQHKNIDVTFR